jgi:hypothetical protein
MAPWCDAPWLCTRRSSRYPWDPSQVLAAAQWRTHTDCRPNGRCKPALPDCQTCETCQTPRLARVGLAVLGPTTRQARASPTPVQASLCQDERSPSGPFLRHNTSDTGIGGDTCRLLPAIPLMLHDASMHPCRGITRRRLLRLFPPFHQNIFGRREESSLLGWNSIPHVP